jgi:hypothetical protein
MTMTEFAGVVEAEARGRRRTGPCAATVAWHRREVHLHPRGLHRPARVGRRACVDAPGAGHKPSEPVTSKAARGRGHLLRCLIALLFVVVPGGARGGADGRDRPGDRDDGAPALTSFAIDGDIGDVVGGTVGGEPVLAVSSATAAGRRVTLVEVRTGRARPGPGVPVDAVGFDLCGDHLVFVDGAGLVDDTGRRILAAEPLLAIADPRTLVAAGACPAPRERLLAVRDGLLVTGVDHEGAAVGAPRLLRFAARARAFSGQEQRGLRGERGYGAALSLYAPRVLAVDGDGDGNDDLVALHEGRLALFLREGGRLREQPVVRDLAALLRTGDDDLRVRVAPGRVVASVSAGAMPERSRVVVVDGTPAAPLSRVAFDRQIDGLALVLGVDPGGRPVHAVLDTSLVAVSGVVLTGRVAVALHVGDAPPTGLTAAADVRAGRIDGALPIVDVDLDGDGRADVLDLGLPGRAVLRPAARGFAEGAALVVPRFRTALALPALGVVALVGDARGARSTLTLVARRR